MILTAIVTVLRSARRFLPDAAGPSADAEAMRRLLDRAMVRLLPRAALVAIVLAVMTLLVRWTTALSRSSAFSGSHQVGYREWVTHLVGDCCA